MQQYNLDELKDEELCKLIENRWNSSSEVWDVLNQIYKENTAVYSGNPKWTSDIPEIRRNSAIQTNRIFVNTESVINSVIANSPGINILPANTNAESEKFARDLESYLKKKFQDLNIKEVQRMGLRNLYFSRFYCVKAFWNPKISEIGDFDFKVCDPRKIRVNKTARKEKETEFVIEEITDNLCSIVARFPNKKEEILKKFGINDEKDLYIKNPEATYKEAWIGNYVIFKLENIILGKIKNPYWDWDGLLVTEDENRELESITQDKRRDYLQNIKLEQDSRKQNKEESYKQYFFNYFDAPRKPYIFGTIFNNENKPIGSVDMIGLASSLQRSLDKRKVDIGENCELANGIIKVESSVMNKSDAQRIRWETKGLIWGKGVKDGVSRETGQPLPAMTFQDVEHSEQNIDNIMAASSAFRGEREGQETKAGRLALIQQSFLRLNELVQFIDNTYKEMFDWAVQFSKTRYTEYHYAKWMGQEVAQEVVEIIQDDFEQGIDIVVIPGKTLPVDDEFKFEQAQADFDRGALGLVDYLEYSNYDNAKELAKNAVIYKQNPAEAVGITPDEMPLPAEPGKLQPNQAMEMMNEGLQPTMEFNNET
jgi:hypothetical protein